MYIIYNINNKMKINHLSILQRLFECDENNMKTNFTDANLQITFY